MELKREIKTESTDSECKVCNSSEVVTGNHFILLDECKTVIGTKVFRIKCTKTFGHANEGDLGGWVEKASNIRDRGWVAKEAVVMDNAIVRDDALVMDEACIRDNAVVMNGSIVSGTSTVRWNARVSNHSIVEGSSNITDNAIVSNHSIVRNSSMSDNSCIEGNSSLSHSSMSGNSRICQFAEVTDSSISDNSIIYGKANVYKARVMGNSLIDYNIITLTTDRWTVSFVDQFINIGCKSHTLKEWRSFSDEDISRMSGEALAFWNKWKFNIFSIYEVHNKMNLQTLRKSPVEDSKCEAECERPRDR